MCDAIYIGNIQHTQKGMDDHFSDILRLLKNGHKSYSFDACNGAVKRFPGGIVCIGGFSSEGVLFICSCR